MYCVTYCSIIQIVVVWNTPIILCGVCVLQTTTFPARTLSCQNNWMRHICKHMADIRKLLNWKFCPPLVFDWINQSIWELKFRFETSTYFYHLISLITFYSQSVEFISYLNFSFFSGFFNLKENLVLRLDILGNNMALI